VVWVVVVRTVVVWVVVVWVVVMWVVVVWVVVVRTVVVQMILVLIATMRVAIVRISMVLVGGGMVLTRALARPLVQGSMWPPVQGSISSLAEASVWPLARVLMQALWRLLPTHKICGKSYLYQKCVDPAGKSGKCGDESVGESPSVRMLRMPLSPPTKLFPLTTEAPESV
jgi:hypothetical protein